MANRPPRPKYCAVCDKQAIRRCVYCNALLCGTHECPKRKCDKQRQRAREAERQDQLRVEEARKHPIQLRRQKMGAQKERVQRLARRAAKQGNRRCEICGRHDVDVRVCVYCDLAFCQLCGSFVRTHKELIGNASAEETKIKQEWSRRGIALEDIIWSDIDVEVDTETVPDSYGSYVELPLFSDWLVFSVPECEICQADTKAQRGR